MKKKMLRVASSLSLPLDAVTQKIAWLGRTGSGKTFGCKRMVEQMLHAGAQVIILDGSGGWAGLRLGPKAFKIPVLGGLYGDIPLEPTAGALVADVIVDRGTSMVLDVSQMLDAERTRFATAFAQRFFRRKKASPGAVHLVLEECQDFVPENQQRGEEQMLHEFQRLAKQGRPHGIGISFISQRPQEISKKALNQAECVFAFQMNGPHERKALQYWLTDKGFEGKLADVLPTLEIGHPYVWSPQWLKISEIVKITPIESLDTSQTPKVGRGAKKRQALKRIDLTVLNKAMAETIERAKAEDPKLIPALRAENAKLKAALAEKTAPTPAAKGITLGKFDVVVDRRRLEKLRESSKRFETKLLETATTLALSETLRRFLTDVPGAYRPKYGANRPSPPPPVGLSVVHQEPKRTNVSNGHEKLSPIARKILTALAQHGRSMTKSQLAVRVGYSSKGGYFTNTLSALRTREWVSGREEIEITDVGATVLGGYDPLPTGSELLEYWARELGGGGERILYALRDGEHTREDLALKAGFEASGGYFANTLSKMRTLQLIVGRDPIRLSEELVG